MYPKMTHTNNIKSAKKNGIISQVTTCSFFITILKKIIRSKTGLNRNIIGISFIGPSDITIP